jgi:hypothetical protein
LLVQESSRVLGIWSAFAIYSLFRSFLWSEGDIELGKANPLLDSPLALADRLWYQAST